MAIGAAGVELACAVRPRPREPISLTSLTRTLDIESIWSDVRAAIGEVAASLPHDRIELRGLGVAAARHTLVVLGKSGGVAFASGNDDLRAAFIGAGVDERAGADLMRRAGHRPALIFWPGKLAWLDSEAPKIASQALRALPLEAWLSAQLTGNRSIGPASATETGAWAPAAGRWLSELLPDWAGAILPEVSAGMRAGPLRSDVAAELGLPAGLPVALGQPDTPAAEFATRHLDDGRLDCVTAGWSTTVLRSIPAWMEVDDVWRTVAIGGGYLAESNAGDGASGYTWLRQLAPQGHLTAHADAALSAADEGLFVSTGLRAMDPAVPEPGMAAMVAPVPFADGVPSPALMAVAVLEDLAFAIRANQERLNRVAQPGAGIALSGGYAGVPATGEILAHVAGTPVHVVHATTASGWGAAMCAAVAADDYHQADVTQALAPPSRRCLPEAGRARIYDEHFARWVELRRRLDGFVQDVL